MNNAVAVLPSQMMERPWRLDVLVATMELEELMSILSIPILTSLSCWDPLLLGPIQVTNVAPRLVCRNWVIELPTVAPEHS